MPSLPDMTNCDAKTLVELRSVNMMIVEIQTKELENDDCVV